MEYSKEERKALLVFINELNKYLIDEKKVKLSELKDLSYFLDETVKNKISGTLKLSFGSKETFKDGTVETLSETFTFTKEHYYIKAFSQQDYFGEYNTDNDSFRVGEREKDEWVMTYIEEGVESAWDILKKKNGLLEVRNEKFSIAEKK